MNPDPRWYGLPHSELRPVQLDAISKVYELHKSGGGVIFIDSPVGTGKSAIASALGAFDTVTVFTSTLELLSQYEEIYGFSAIRGRQWYSCVYPRKLATWKKPLPPTAYDCHFSPMQSCPAASECPYLHAKWTGLVSRRLVCTYRYGAISQSLQRRGGFLVFDECDVSAKEIVGHAEMLITNEERQQWSFPDFPSVETGLLENKDALTSWLWQCNLALPSINPESELQMAMAGEVEKKRKKITGTIEKLEQGDWFANLSDGILTLKPLTANRIIQSAYNNKRTVVLMSATIGNPKSLAVQLGLDSYQYVEYPHPTPAEYRPVYAIPGSPKMTYTPLGIDDPKYLIQGVQLWQWISQNIDPSWRGIVLTSSAAKANKLQQILSSRFDNRTVITGKSSELIDRFKKDKRKGLIAVGYLQGWSHGVDLFGDFGPFFCNRLCTLSRPKRPLYTHSSKV
jgi:hypothetical protein